VQPGCRREEFPELPFGAELDFGATILGDHPELGPARIDLQCRSLFARLISSSGVVADARACRAASTVINGWLMRLVFHF
jgi:hypothetical protein